MIAAVVLAAGAARRFGAQKLLAPVGDRPLVRWTVEEVLASGAERTLVVLGREADRVRAALADLAVDFVVNARYAGGMSTSVRAGIEALGPDAAAALIALGDQPVPREVLQRLLRAHRASGLPIVAPSYRGRRGNPVLFDASMFDALRRLQGDRGARGLVDANPGRLLVVPFPFAAPPDVDTPEELAALGPALARGLQRPGGSTTNSDSQGSR